MIINLSVWESIEALWRFVYDSEHLAVMRRRREWFERMKLFMTLWWVEEGHIPTVEEAIARLDDLRRDGPTPRAFTFKKRFPPPGETGVPQFAGTEKGQGERNSRAAT